MPFHSQKQQSLKKSALKTGVVALVRHFEVIKINFYSPAYFFVRAHDDSKAFCSTRFPYKGVFAEINDLKGHTQPCKFTIGERFLSVSLCYYLAKLLRIRLYSTYSMICMFWRLVVSQKSIFGHRYFWYQEINRTRDPP